MTYLDHYRVLSEAFTFTNLGVNAFTGAGQLRLQHPLCELLVTNQSQILIYL